MYDTIIIGAGPAGSAAAHYLAKEGLDILLLDKFDFPRDKTCGDALTPLALEALDDIGILDDMRRVGCTVKRLEVFAPNGQATTASFPPGKGRPGAVLIIPRLILDNALRERALASGARFQGRIHVTAIEQLENGVVVKGGGHGRSVSLKGRMAVVATGASVKLLLNMGLLPEPPVMTLAARAYFEKVGKLTDSINFYFAGVPLPGYGWVFPLSDSAANIGAGFLPRGRAVRRGPATPAVALQNFIQTPALQAMLAQARQTGPVKGYPLRMDFATAPTFGERILLVGEAAGLVNPLTGEGIDYALESGKIAAQNLSNMFAAGDFSRQRLVVYDQHLRRRFQALFLFCYNLQGLIRHRFLLNRLVKAATYQADLRTLLVNSLLGNYDISAGLSRKVILKALYTLVVADFL